MASPFVIPCLICRYKGATRLLIYCTECKQVSIHRYCLSKFYREDESIHWICWKCEARIHWERKASTRKGEKHSRTLKGNYVNSSYVTRRTNYVQMSNLSTRTAVASQEARSLKGNDVKSYVTRRTNYVQRCNLTVRTAQASQGARTLKGNDFHRSYVTRRTTQERMILKTNLGFSIDAVPTVEKGRLINLEADFQTSFSRKVCLDVTREISQVINLNKQGKGIQKRRKIILDDIDFDEEYEQRDHKSKGERRMSLVTGGTSYFKEDIAQGLKNMDEIDKLRSQTTYQRMCNNGFLLKGVEHAKPIDLKRTNKLHRNPKRLIHDGSESDEYYQQKKRPKRRLILSESSSSEEDDVPTFDIDQDGKGLENQRRYEDCVKSRRSYFNNNSEKRLIKYHNGGGR